MTENHKIYLDDKHCITLTPWNGAYDNENPTLFSSEYFWLKRYLYRHNAEDNDKMRKFHLFTNEGLPRGLYRRRLPEDTSEVSHDEYTGKMILIDCGYLPHKVADDICEYGKKNFWSYNDKKPYKLDFSKIRQSRDIYIYKLMSNEHPPNIFEYLYFCLTFLVGTYSSLKANGGNKILWWFRYAVIKRNGGSGFLCDYISKLFHKRYKLSELCKMYYKDPSHPITELASRLYGK